jgi:S-adenosylmethionine hydrolase
MIVLPTDFGQGEYVGAMKGVIYSANADVKLRVEAGTKIEMS